MRYRPLGVTGMSVSVVSMVLPDTDGRNRPADWRGLIYAALEHGVNTFEVVGRHPSIAEGLVQALDAVERRLVFIGWRLGETMSHTGALARDFSPAGLRYSTESILSRTGLDYLDAVILDDPKSEELAPDALQALKDLRSAGKVRMLGVAGEDDAIDAYITTGAFDVLATPFNLTSGWKQRLRLKAAIERNMGVIGYDHHPHTLRRSQAPVAKSPIWGGAKAKPLEGMGTYAFLDTTPRWTSEELCLAYALTEPCLATVQVIADKPERLASLAAVAERDLPPGAAAQIEMARFGPTGAAATARHA
jgi:aryl-alcohol dehydrogenase-like predicted oxidoreductase